jgi:hypothetical protein
MAETRPDKRATDMAKKPPVLPPLTGPAFRLFELVWLLMLAAAIVAPLGGAWVRREQVRTSMDAVSLAIDLLPPLLLVATAVLLHRRRRRDSVAALLSLSFLLMSGSFFAAEGFFRALDLAWLRDLLAHGGRAALLLVLLAFPDGRFSPRWSAWVALALLVWAPFAWLGPVPLDAEYLGYLALLVLAVLSIALPYRQLPGGLERQQVRWVLFGFAAGTILLAAAVAVTFLPDARAGPAAAAKTWNDLAAQTLAALGMAGFALGLLVSLLRYRLYDADAVISRSAGYAVLTIVLGATFAITVKGIDALIEASFGQEAGALPSVVGGGLAVALISPLNTRIQNWAERRFQKALLHLRRDLPDCVGDLRETGSLAELLDEVMARLAAGVRASRLAMLIGGEVAALRGVTVEDARAWREGAAPNRAAAALDCDRADPVFPMRIPLRVRHGGGEALGWILLGPRPDGSFYGKDEREALAEIADPVARAVQIVLLREAREAEARQRAERQERRLGTMERQLAKALRKLGPRSKPLAGEAAE